MPTKSKATKDREDRAQEVRDEQIDTRLKGMTNVPDTTLEEILDSDGETVGAEVIGGVLHLHLGGKTARFDREALFRLEKLVRRAKQAV